LRSQIKGYCFQAIQAHLQGMFSVPAICFLTCRSILLQMSNVQQKTTQLSISSLKVVGYTINEQNMPAEGQDFNISFDLQHNVNPPAKEMQLLLTVTYWGAQIEQPALQIKVQNGFIVSNLEDFVTEGRTPNEHTINMPGQLMAAMLDMSIHHTRALIARNTSGTKLERNFLPLINPVEMLQQLQQTAQQPR